MDVNKDIADFLRRADVAYAAMREAEGQVATFCRDDARFYLGRAIEIAKASGRKDVVARLKTRRAQIMGAFHAQRRPSPPPGPAIERWENEGGATGAGSRRHGLGKQNGPQPATHPAGLSRR